ncbi:hypothetical protein CS379_06680, partial [Methylobacterium frigidaeris]
QWSRPKIVVTRRGERQLAKAPGTPEFEEAWSLAHDDLSEYGFAWECMGTVGFWERRDLDHSVLRDVIDSLPDRAARREAEALRREEERREEAARREAEQRERDRAYIEGAREAARASLRGRRWSWAKTSLIDEAQELLARPELDRAHAGRLILLVDQAATNVGRSEKRTSQAHEPEMRRADDPAVQAAALEGVRHITLHDEDWASVQNGVGWSRSTTCDGHVLAGLDRLTIEQTSHALRLLRVHRKQLPGRIFLALFALRLPAAQATLSLSDAG